MKHEMTIYMLRKLIDTADKWSATKGAPVKNLKEAKKDVEASIAVLISAQKGEKQK